MRISFVAAVILATVSTGQDSGSQHSFPSGVWEGWSDIIVSWCDQDSLRIEIFIDQVEGTAAGSFGDAVLSGFLSDQDPVMRILGNGTWLVVASLEGPVVESEGIQRDSVTIYLDIEGSVLTGSFHTSGGKFGGAESMRMTGSDLHLTLELN